MKEKSCSSHGCNNFHGAIEFIGRRWMGILLLVLMSGPYRFSELLSKIDGISDRLLTERLRELEKEGLVERKVVSDSPVRVEYQLTPIGRELNEVIVAITSWSDKKSKVNE